MFNVTTCSGSDLQPGNDLKIGTVNANGLNFSFIEMGQGPLVLALHGFPDLPRTFRYQMPHLAMAGYRVVAPYMRGYFPTDAPSDGRYESAALVQDVLALTDALSPDPIILLGHDWGAQAALGAAIIAPHKVAKLITIAVPPGLSRFFITNPEQQRRSWYMFLFQMSFAEKAVAHSDFAFLERLWQDWSPGWQCPAEEMAALKATFQKPGVLHAALKYYRHTLNPANHSPELAHIREHMGDPVNVPALYLHGVNDGCIGVETTEGMERAFTKIVEKRIIPDSGHFVHQEKPEAVNKFIMEFLKK
jgi:pimeloyl-ACP methyl ester carboxylesterase